MIVLTLSDVLRETINKSVLRAFPKEGCGLLIGMGERIINVTKVVPTENIVNSAHKFLIDPQVQFDWVRKLRSSRQRIIGHYHSHPNGRCKPSAHDIEMAQDYGQVWLIIPMGKGHPTGMNAYQAQAANGLSAISIRKSQ